MMKIQYTSEFIDSLDQIIHYWQSQLMIDTPTITKFTRHIYRKINLLSFSPKMGQDVTELYHFNNPTRRILIGHSYAIFYRINFQSGIIIIGLITGTSQMKIKF